MNFKHNISLGNYLLLSIIGLLIIAFCILSCFPNINVKRVHYNYQVQKMANEDWTVSVIPNGGSIYAVLDKAKVPMSEIAMFTDFFGDKIDVTTIQPGDTIKFVLTPDKQRIQKLQFIQEIDIRHLFYLENDSLHYKMENLPVQTRTRLLTGNLNGTLDASLLALGLTPREKQQINNGLEAEINFHRDARNEDVFEVLIEERYFNGQRLANGKLLYVSYNGKRTGFHELFRYQEQDEKSVLNGLYTKSGKSGGGSGVGFPLSRIHVISSYGRRIDPVYRSWAMHQGIDYKAGYGTPVYSVANGTVLSSGWNGGYGNTIRIKHGSGMSTLYAHLSSLGVHTGQSVRKGQIIGRVGSTGKSTGAHLHFGLLRGSSYINPSNLKMVGTEQLNSNQMSAFIQQQHQIINLVNQYRKPV